MSIDLYDILGVSPDADEATIKSAFRELAQQYHPDLNPDDPEAEEMFKEVLAAFEILSDPEQRRQYDAHGLEAVETNHAPTTSAPHESRTYDSNGSARASEYRPDLGEVFTDVFDGRSPFDTSHMRDFGDLNSDVADGDDITRHLSVEFMDAVLGRDIEVELDGEIVRLSLPSGAETGDRLVLSGRGESPPTALGKPGDLVFELEVQDHHSLRRRGLDLELAVPLRVDEAVLGAEIQIPTPHGAVEVEVPSGVSSGAKLRLEGLGIQREGEQGDFYAVLEIYTPDVIDDHIESAVRTLREGYSESPRSDLDL